MTDTIRIQTARFHDGQTFHEDALVTVHGALTLVHFTSPTVRVALPLATFERVRGGLALPPSWESPTSGFVCSAVERLRHAVEEPLLSDVECGVEVSLLVRHLDALAGGVSWREGVPHWSEAARLMQDFIDPRPVVVENRWGDGMISGEYWGLVALESYRGRRCATLRALGFRREPVVRFDLETGAAVLKRDATLRITACSEFSTQRGVLRSCMTLADVREVRQ